MQPAGRSRAHRRWILGRYVQLTSLLQLLVYGTAVFARDPTPVLRSFDPRFLIDITTEMMVRGPQSFPSAVSWLSAFAMLCVGEAVVQGRSGLVLYVAVEGAYAALFMAFAALIVAANLSPSHGFRHAS